MQTRAKEVSRTISGGLGTVGARFFGTTPFSEVQVGTCEEEKERDSGDDCWNICCREGPRLNLESVKLIAMALHVPCKLEADSAAG